MHPSTTRRAAAAAVLLLAPAALAGTRYVNVGLATGANDGSSWADAYRTIDGVRVALVASVAGDEIWVAEGTYKATATATRSIYHPLKTGVAVYGGFAGAEATLAERDFLAHPTILSGDLGSNDGSGIFTDNAFHVVDGASANATAILDGFTITGGNANGSGAANQDKGGGMLFLASSNATIRNCVVTSSRCTFGGGACYVNGSSPTFEDCTFESCFGGSFGGAFDMNTVGCVFRRCTFRWNTAARAGGVEIFGGSNVTLTNCLFTGNTATGTSSGGGGGILVLSGATATIRLCTVVGNTASTAAGAGLVVTGATASVANSIFYSNTGVGGAQNTANNVSGGSVTWSCVQGGLAGTGNIATAPVFADAPSGDFRLVSGSPGVDAGNVALVPAGTTTDRAGAPRLTDDLATPDTGFGAAPVVDLGCFEHQPPLFRTFCAGDGIDAAVTTPCPCGNTGAFQRGCANSVDASGGRLVATGTAANDDVVLFGDGMPASVACIYLQGDAQDDATFGDGVRCAGGTLVRLRTKVNAGGASQFPDSTDTVTLSQRGGVAVGSGAVRLYQTYYRNAASGFCPPETFNVTNGWMLAW